MQASVQHYPTEDLNAADTSCLSRTSARHFDDRPGPCSEENARIPVSKWLIQLSWSTDAGPSECEKRKPKYTSRVPKSTLS